MSKRKTTKKEKIIAIKSCGNIFEDLQLPDAKNLQTKSDLVGKIAEIIKRRRLTQVQAAKILGVDQPKISALLSGRLSGFSIDRLFKFLSALEQDIEIVVRPTRTHRAGRVAVSTTRSLRA